MPKMKTHRGAAKRLKKTATKKIKAFHAFHSHLLGWKTARRKRRLRQGTILSPAETKRVKRLLPY